MYRGTSPTFRIRLNNESIPLDLIKTLWITIRSNQNEVTKELKDCEMIESEHIIQFKLSQEDTLSLSTGEAQIQLRILMQDGTAMATPIKRLAISNILKEGVIQ